MLPVEVIVDMIIAMMSFLVANPAPMPLSVPIIFALLSLPISAMILRKAVGMFNNRTISDDECVRIPSFLVAMGISLFATIIAAIVSSSTVFVSQSIFRLSPEELRSGYIVLLMIPSVVVSFFAYSGVLRWLMSVNYGTGMLIVLNDYVVRFVILLILGGIAFVLDGIRLSLSR
tara:strand:- start:1684 stop:2205 length:522 start_codon:yes stop_codon:yes gene_type:complete